MFNRIKQKLKEKLNKMNQDDRGSAFVFVVIGIMFVSIVGATVLSLATNYVVTVIVDHYSTDNFYQTEGLIAEVRSGIEEIAGESNEEAYNDVMQNYNSPKDRIKEYLSLTSEEEFKDCPVQTMEDLYAVEYLSGIISRLNPEGISVVWNGKEESESLKWHELKMGKIKKMTTNPDAVGSTYGADTLRYGFNVDTDTKEMSLTIKGLLVDYTDETGYRTNIKTDINITVPDYGFEGDDTFNQLKDYIVISDDMLSVNNNMAEQSEDGAKFTGNVYTGGEVGKKFVDSNPNSYKTGIQIASQAKAVFNSKMIISRGDLELLKGANVNISGEGAKGDLWLKNILLTAGDPASLLKSRLSIDDDAYILNDLSIDDNNAVVDIAGKYYGYSYNEENTDSAGAQKSEYSSAILVNGKNTTLTSTNLDKLILSGRTFVSRNTENNDSVISDIMMGESLAVKSNQIAYLLPDKFIKADHNPLLKTEINAANINDAIYLDVLQNDTTIWPFLNPAEPVTANFNNTGGYVFLYLNFASQDKANKYFAQFYSDSDNRQELDDRAQTYISTTDLEGMKLSANLYLIAGNIIHNYYSSSGHSEKQDANYFSSSGDPNTELLTDGARKMQNYLGKQLALVNSGFKSYMNSYRYELLDGEYQKELVEDVIIDFDKVDADGTVSRYDSNTNGTIYITSGNYTVNGSITKGLIVSGGDVTVEKSFEGLIIARGKVTVTGPDIQLKANISMLNDLLDIVKKDSHLSKYFRGLNDDEDKSIYVAECINYENWSRNSN